MTDYFMIFISVVLLSAGFVLQRYYQDCTDNGNAGVRFSITAGLFSIGIMIVMNGFSPEFSWYSLINALLKTLAGFIYTLLGFWLMKQGKMVLYTLFLMSGGMLLPYIFGIVFLNEMLTPLRVLGILAVLTAVILSNFSKQKANRKHLPLCIAVFVLNGFVSIISKCHQITDSNVAISSSGFVIYSGIGKCICSVLAILLYHRGCSVPAVTHKTSFSVAAGASAVGAASYLLQLVGAKALPASVLYPVITGGSILVSLELCSFS